jgi:mono/diheme cytochrome c family protein
MVPVIIIAVVFTGLAAAIFWAAPRGKMAPLTNAMFSQSAGARAGLYTVFAVTYVGFGIVIPIIFLIGNHNHAKSVVKGVTLTSAQVEGASAFAGHCAVCHTLAAASAVGETGPNLDQLKPSFQETLNVIMNGCLADPLPGQTGQKCFGEGNMPAGTVSGQDAVNVAQYVAAVAGKG